MKITLLNSGFKRMYYYVSLGEKGIEIDLSQIKYAGYKRIPADSKIIIDIWGAVKDAV